MSGADPGREVESWDGLQPIYDTVGQDTGGRDEWTPTDVPEGALVDLEGADERIAKATIDALERPRKSEGIHRGHLPLLDLPGFGSATSDSTSLSKRKGSSRTVRTTIRRPPT